MAEPFDPVEIDDLDESLLADMTLEDMAEFREKLLATLDDMETFEPDIGEEEEEYYEWEDRMNILHDLIDAIDAQIRYNRYRSEMLHYRREMYDH